MRIGEEEEETHENAGVMVITAALGMATKVVVM